MMCRAITRCGDGIVQSGEQCDDGNVEDGDGCRGDCSLEACGDGRMDAGEQCDDGNAVNGDGCSAMCAIEECPMGQTRNQQGKCVEFIDPDDPSQIEDCGCTVVPSANQSPTGWVWGVLLMSMVLFRRRRKD
jgi:MYXO-CTERM domain-containing protein